MITVPFLKRAGQIVVMQGSGEWSAMFYCAWGDSSLIGRDVLL